MPDEAKKESTASDEKAPESKPAAAPGRPPNILTRPTDHAARPGFRSKPNKNSKAQKKKR